MNDLNSCHRLVEVNVTSVPHTVTVAPEAFVMVIRKDGLLATGKLAACLAKNSDFPFDRASSLLLESYYLFCQELYRIFSTCLPHSLPNSGWNEIHLLEPEQLKNGVYSMAEDCHVVSMDQMLSGPGVLQYASSRVFCLGGVCQLGHTARPGHPSLAQQVRNIRSSVGGRDIVFTDDDVFTGGSLCRALEQIGTCALTKIIPQIQIASPSEKVEDLAPVHPVVQYHSDRDRIELCDMRDFLLGASGLVVKMPDGQLGRVPYVMPFTDPTERASVPVSVRLDFSQRVLRANYRFFERIERELGFEILVEHLDPSFAVFLKHCAVPASASAKECATWAGANLSKIWCEQLYLGSLQAQIEQLRLPERFVLLDVNGTLLPDYEDNFALRDTDVASLVRQVCRLERIGIAVGLCSDSPLDDLVRLADRLSLRGPIFAESGGVVTYNSEEQQFRFLIERQALFDQIALLAFLHDYRVPDWAKSGVGSPEFANLDDEPRFLDYESGEWAFGRGRKASLSVFAPAPLIELIVDWVRNSGLHHHWHMDVSPEYNFLGIHAYPVQECKGEIIDLMAQFGKQILMVGNSNSDLVREGAACAFVGNAQIAPNQAQYIAQNQYTAQNQYIAGVIEILSKIEG